MEKTKPIDSIWDKTLVGGKKYTYIKIRSDKWKK